MFECGVLVSMLFLQIRKCIGGLWLLHLTRATKACRYIAAVPHANSPPTRSSSALVSRMPSVSEMLPEAEYSMPI